MPVITIAMHKVKDEVKTELIRGMTATAAGATGIPSEKFIVLIDEMDDGNIGLGGKSLKEIKAEK